MLGVWVSTVGSHADGGRSLPRAGVTVQQNEAEASTQLISDLPPVASRRFTRPIAQYKAFARLWTVRLGREAASLTAVLRAGRRSAARRDWMTTFSDYLHLGAVYGLLPAGLNDRLARVPSATNDDDFFGLHRLEKGLWTRESLRSLVPISLRLSRAVVTLRHVLPLVSIGPQEYVTRAHEILEDAQRDLMSGADVPWSHAGVLGTAAGLSATKEMISTLTPLLDGRDETLGVTRYWLARLTMELSTVRRRGGTYPSLIQLPFARRELIDAALAGALGALAQVPGALETASIAPSRAGAR